MKVLVPFSAALLLTFFTNNVLWAHCEMPCGIYTDNLRIEMIKEDITTIEKSMNEIVKLSAQSTPDYHSIARWTVNKEDHAGKIQDVVAQYFMHQRVKPVEMGTDQEARDKYLAQLELLHKMQISAMKCKQTTDLAHVDNLRKLTDEFAKSYFGDEYGTDHHH